jgi:uncharacterized protein YkwD
MAAPARAATGTCTPAPWWPATQPALADDVVALVNAHRQALGLPTLRVSPTLAAAATWKARDMAAVGYLAHDDRAPSPHRSVADRLGACGYPSGTWGENIAMGYASARAVVAAWLSSPDHRANIEDPAYRAVGVAAAGARGTLYWAEDFGAKVDVAAGAVDVSRPTADAAPPPATDVRARCAPRGRPRMTCRVRGLDGAVVRIVLDHGGRAYARAGGHRRASRHVP